jgi:adenine-specific DNA-methyltransferase
MSERLDRFTKLLKEIFELDKSDLDFGIYRVMNLRKEQVEDFLTNRLPQMVQETLAPFAQDSKDEIRREMSQIEESVAEMGMTIDALPETAQKKQQYLQLKKQLAEGADLSALETDVYSALYSFFNRYYEDGDFISKRRYKEGVYAIPYEGEEVKLYWANQDQYYIKTSENFKDYTFVFEGITVHFRLVDATTEQNNNKESNDAKRTFMLFTEDEENYPGIKTFEYDPDSAEIIIRFIYDVQTKYTGKADTIEKKWREDNCTEITAWLLSLHRDELNPLIAPVPTGKGSETTTLLEKHLKGYVAKNTFDYFIHKDLRGFLTRELDFFIKSEIMHLEDLDTENEKRVETYLAKIKAIKRVGKVIIDFLAQIEDFQKKLWLKKKFVVETNWCITLDKIDESFWSDIIANKSQLSEWEEIYKLSKINGYCNPLTIDFLRKNKHLTVDTRYFSGQFKNRLVANISHLSDRCSGELLMGDNFHANNLLLERYRKQVKCIYIDPPFNLEKNGDFMYKTNYCDSSWLAMLKDRLIIAKELLRDDGCIFVRCDYHGNSIVRLLLDELFGKSNYKNEIILNRFQKAADGLTTTTESLFLYSNTHLFEFKNVEKPRICVFCKSPIEPKWMWSHSAGAGNSPRYFTVDGERVLLYPPKGRHWTNKQDVIDQLEADGRIRIDYSTKYTDCNGDKIQYIPEKLQSNAVELDNNWTDIAGYEFGVFTKEKFSTQNAEELLERVVTLATNEGDLVMDFFMGSGTTQAVSQKLNRRWIGVEMGDYFYSTPLKRMKGINKEIFKYVRIENYEDALSNIELSDNSGQLSALLGEDYLIHYMVDLESRGSLLDVEAFSNPFAYTMKITEKNECKERPVDLVETFNYLIGLTVSNQSRIIYCVSKPAEEPEYPGAVELVEEIKGQIAFQHIEGTLPDERRALVIWRTVTDDLVASNAALDAYFTTHRKNAENRDYDVIFVNGDNNLENLRNSSVCWIVKMTENEFKNRMFEEE